MKKMVILSLVIALVLSLTGCELYQTTSAPAESVTQVNVDRDFVYEWMLENGKLQNGEELVYTFKDGQRELTVETDASKCIYVHYTFQDESGYNVKVNIELFQEGQDRFNCEIVDDTETGAEHDYTFHRATFTRKSPIENGEEQGYYIDGEFVDAIWMSPEGPKIPKERHSSPDEYEPLPDDKYTVIHDIRENFAERAQQHLCSTLDAIHHGFCVPMGITLHDLGYEKFEAQQLEGGENAQLDVEYGYTDL